MGVLTTKPVAVLEAEAEVAGDEAGGLRRVLGPLELTVLGVGAIVGLGAVALTGYLASLVAGPAVSLAFGLAAIACLLAALCFAELASTLPSAGGPYAWAYASLGELPAWLVAWCLLLEYVLGAATVAVGWARHLGDLLFDLRMPGAAAFVPGATERGIGVGVAGALLVVVLTLALLRGVRAAARLNMALAAAKLLALLVLVAGGALAASSANWTPFVPPADANGRFGWGGVFRATSAVFFAYLGFDAIATTAGEARHPRRDVPRAMLWSLGLCALLYVALALAVTGARRFDAFVGIDPVPVVIGAVGDAPMLVLGVRVGLSVGLAGVVLVLLLAAARVCWAMARDGLLPAALGRVEFETGAPRRATILVGAIAAVVAAFAPMDQLGDAITAGALLAFIGVFTSMLVLRRTRPELARPFRVPAGQPVAAVGLLVSLALFLDAARHRPVVVSAALFIGLVLYFAYPAGHSRAGRLAARAGR